jgi:hypothetical protein
MQGCESHKKFAFFGMLSPLKIITFVYNKLQNSYEAYLKANEMLFSEIHSDTVVLVSDMPQNIILGQPWDRL